VLISISLDTTCTALDSSYNFLVTIFVNMFKKSVGKSFRGIHLAHTDDFGYKNDKIRLWVINNGGAFSKDLNEEVTHLVCSKKAWKGYKDIGKLP
jgi:twin BRCT domain